MSTTLLEALLLFVSLFATSALVGCVGWLYRALVWWHEQRQLPRLVRVVPLRGEVHLLEVRGYDGGELLGSVRMWPAADDDGS